MISSKLIQAGSILDKKKHFPTKQKKYKKLKNFKTTLSLKITLTVFQDLNMQYTYKLVKNPIQKVFFLIQINYFFRRLF